MKNSFSFHIHNTRAVADYLFTDKIYQATKYVLGKLGTDYVPAKTISKTGKETLAERWILHKLNSCAQEMHAFLDEREFSRSSQLVYQYWYDNFCDVYVVCLGFSYYREEETLILLGKL